MKTYIAITTGVIGAVLTELYGVWDAVLTTLCIFIIIDYITGLTKGIITRKLSSSKASLGLFKKFLILLIVVMGNRMDVLMGTDYIKAGICYAFIASEGLSILENAAECGVPIPTQILDVLNSIGGDKHDRD